MNQQELEDRLIDFAVVILNLVGMLPASAAGNHLGGQLMRSGTSPALNYGEARAAESRKDFIHKVKIVLKELRESLICQKIIERSSLLPHGKDFIQNTMKENNELISIFVVTLKSLSKEV